MRNDHERLGKSLSPVDISYIIDDALGRQRCCRAGFTDLPRNTKFVITITATCMYIDNGILGLPFVLFNFCACPLLHGSFRFCFNLAFARNKRSFSGLHKMNTRVAEHVLQVNNINAVSIRGSNNLQGILNAGKGSILEVNNLVRNTTKSTTICLLLTINEPFLVSRVDF